MNYELPLSTLTILSVLHGKVPRYFQLWCKVDVNRDSKVLWSQAWIDLEFPLPLIVCPPYSMDVLDHAPHRYGAPRDPMLHPIIFVSTTLSNVYFWHSSRLGIKMHVYRTMILPICQRESFSTQFWPVPQLVRFAVIPLCDGSGPSTSATVERWYSI